MVGTTVDQAQLAVELVPPPPLVALTTQPSSPGRGHLELFNQRLGGHRCLASRPLRTWSLRDEETSESGTRTNRPDEARSPVQREPQPLAALDLVRRSRAGRERSCRPSRSRTAVPRRFALHPGGAPRPVQRRQQDIAARVTRLAARSAAGRSLLSAFRPRPSETLGHEREQLVMVDRPEKVAQSPSTTHSHPDSSSFQLRRASCSTALVGIRSWHHRTPARRWAPADSAAPAGIPGRRPWECRAAMRRLGLRDALLAHRLRSVGVVAQVLATGRAAPRQSRGTSSSIPSARYPIRFHTLPGQLPLVHLVDESSSRPWVQPVGKSPRSLMFGSFAHGTSTSAPLLISPSCPVPTVFAGRLPQPTRLPLLRSRRFRHASGTSVRLLDERPFPLRSRL